MSPFACSLQGMAPDASAPPLSYDGPMSTQAEPRSVLAKSQAPAVSLLVPTHRAGQEIRQDPIRCLKEGRAPIIPACVKYLAPIYKEISRYQTAPRRRNSPAKKPILSGA